MQIFPFKFEPIQGRYLITNDAGDLFVSTQRFLDNLVCGNLTTQDEEYLLARGFGFKSSGDFYYNSFAHRYRLRRTLGKSLTYLTVIPTLRCDLSCTYCQVSRASEDAKGVDWSDETLKAFLLFVETIDSDRIQIEFQGGEPTLRLDIVKAVIDGCEKRFKNCSFTICTNLSCLSDDLLDLLEKPNVGISTSIDGPETIHTRYRTQNKNETLKTFANVEQILGRFGHDRLGALPTICEDDFDQIEEIIDHYIALGLDTFYLRPVNYHGFARKAFPSSRESEQSLEAVYSRAYEHICNHNLNNDRKIKEYGLEVALKRIFEPCFNNHVDLRNPNPPAQDYLVIDYGGRFYPSDEARMLSRIGHADLCIGSLENGLDSATVTALRWNQINDVHEDCIHCAFQAYCGTDAVDDLARYDRNDPIKHTTHFCRSNMGHFNFIFEKILQNDPKYLFNFSGFLTDRFEYTPFFGNIFYDPA